MITENLSTLKIHKLTQAQYDRELEAGRIDPSALYLTPDSDEYASAIHQHSYNDLLDKPTIPSSLPANGGNADTLDGQHATYFAKASDIANLQTKHIARTVTLYSYNWSSNSQTVTADGVTSSNTIIVSAHPSYQNDYNEKGVVCASQETNTLTFTCKEVPAGNLQVNVIILN